MNTLNKRIIINDYANISDTMAIDISRAVLSADIDYSKSYAHIYSIDDMKIAVQKNDNVTTVDLIKGE